MKRHPTQNLESKTIEIAKSFEIIVYCGRTVFSHVAFKVQITQGVAKGGGVLGSRTLFTLWGDMQDCWAPYRSESVL